MGNKIVAMLSEDSELEAICKRIDQRKQFAEKKMRDIEKQAQDAFDALHKDNKDDWSIVTEWLRNKGRLPADYNEQTHNISFNINNNGIAVDRLDSEVGMPEIKNIGAFPIDSLPPEIRKAMLSFISKNFTDPN